jgi:hypothetical protein
VPSNTEKHGITGYERALSCALFQPIEKGHQHAEANGPWKVVMRLLTGISIASLIVSIAAVVFVLGLYEELDKSGSESRENNSLACAELLAISGSITFPEEKGTRFDYDKAVDNYHTTIKKVDADRKKLGC